MKKSIFVAMILVGGTISAMAQGGGQRLTVEERVKKVHEKIDSAFKPDAQKLTQVDAIFTTYYKETQKIIAEAMSGGGSPDREGMREKMKPFADERDKQLKPVLGDDNFKKWKDEIEPSLMRRGGNRPQQ